MLKNTFSERFLKDFLRIYTTLPARLKRETLWALACVFLQAVLEVAAIVSISFLAVSVTAPERLLQMAPVRFIFAVFPQTAAFCADAKAFALLASFGCVAVVAAKNGMFAVVSKMTAKLGERISLFAGETIFRNYLCSPYIKHLSGESGSMFQAMSWRGNLGAMVAQLLSVYTYIIIVLALIITLLSIIPGTVLIIILALAVTSIGVYKGLKSRIDQASKGAAEKNRAEVEVTMNAMHGIRETIIYRQQDVFFEKFREASLEGIEDRIFLRLAPPIPTWILETAGFLVIPVTMWLMFALQNASMGYITAVLTMIMLVCWRLLPLFNRSMGALVAVRSLRHPALECLKMVEEAQSQPYMQPPKPTPNFSMRRDVAFSDVSFRYPNAEADCLHHLTFTIPCGAIVGFIGQSGAGKSSVAPILSGLVTPTTGEMLVDGASPTPAEQAAYCQQVGYVPQSPYILAGTLAENVAFSQWGKPWDEEKVIKACKMAEVDALDQYGVDYHLGAGGAGLSGGQVQRLSIARALYAEPSVLILDEATSALDTGVETAIMDTIFTLPKSITIIIIAHRLTTVERCDTLFWIEKGALKASGRPASILPQYDAFLRHRSAH